MKVKVLIRAFPYTDNGYLIKTAKRHEEIELSDEAALAGIERGRLEAVAEKVTEVTEVLEEVKEEKPADPVLETKPKKFKKKSKKKSD